MMESTLCDLQYLVHGYGTLPPFELILQLPIGSTLKVEENEYQVINKGLRPDGGTPLREESEINSLLEGQHIQVYLEEFIRAWSRNAGFCARKSLMLRSSLQLAYTGGRLTPNEIDRYLDALAGKEFEARRHEQKKQRDVKLKKLKPEKDPSNGDPKTEKKEKKPKKAK